MSERLPLERLHRHHMNGAAYERLRAAFFKRQKRYAEASRCLVAARGHESAAADAVVGLTKKQRPKNENPSA